MVMEPMSEGSAGVREGMERGKLRGGVRGMGVSVGEEGGLGKRKREDGGEKEEEGERKKRKVRGPKGPNPLSVRKAKRKGEGESKDEGKEGGHGVTSKSDGNVDGSREGRAELATDGGEVLNSAGSKKKRKRKHKSGATATATEDEATTHGEANLG